MSVAPACEEFHQLLDDKLRRTFLKAVRNVRNMHDVMRKIFSSSAKNNALGIPNSTSYAKDHFDVSKVSSSLIAVSIANATELNAAEHKSNFIRRKQ